jgi:predicted AlkP superfamily phosphohydrolase/phosphomutase
VRRGEEQYGRRTGRGPTLLLIGWDGGTPELIERFCRQGSLPTVKRLIDRGSCRRLRSTIPPITACAWSSFLTGRNPGRHGLFDFVTPRPGSYKFDYTNGGHRRDCDADLLSLLNRAGLRVGCINVPMTYPPKSIDGFLVSGLDAPDENSGIAHPAALFEEAQAEVGPYRIDNRHLGAMKNARDRRDALDEFKRIETRRTDVTLAMMRHVAVDVLVLVYNATDQVQHHFWHLMDPTCPGHAESDAQELAAFRNAIEEVYTHCDTELARLVELFPDANIMLLSDHGAGPAKGPRVRLNNALGEAGLLTWAHSKGTLWADAVARFDRFLRRTLSNRQKAALARLLPAGRTAVESLGLPPIDWERTVAFVYEGFTLSPCVWINRRDRFPQGTVAPGEEYERACRQVTDALKELKDPATGAQVVPHVYRADEVYHGEYLETAPDLIPDWWEEPTFTMTRSHPNLAGKSPVFRRSGPVRAGYDITGIHRRDGILVASGPQLESAGEAALPPADLVDVTPTALALLGLQAPTDLDGRVLEGVISGDAGVARPVEPSPTAEAPASSEPLHRYSARQERMIEQRLTDLGYIE